MSLVINHNMMASTAARNLNTAFSSLGTSVSRLSSGLRVTSAADDAAGLAIRELMRADITALNQGVRNANDAISLLQTADGALSVIDEKLIRMKELAEQAATGTYNSDQRLIIDSEYQAMASEITRIANATDFNGIYLLNGNLSADTHNGSGLVSTGKLKVHFGTANDSAEDYYYIQIGSATASSLGFNSGGAAGEVTPDSIAAAQDLNLTQDWLPAGSGAPAILQSAVGYDPAFRIYEKNGAPPLSDRYYLVNDTTTNRYRLFHTNSASTALIGEVDVSNDRAAGTGAGSSISTQELAQQALVTIQQAIVSKDKIRAHLGALQNRLQNTISSLGIQAENLQAAESRISDVDVSLEMTEFVRQQILTQSAVAMLSQANSLPRMAMQLIGG